MGEIIRKQGRRLVAASVIRQRLRLSSAGEFHPHALQEPDMNVTTLFGYLRKPEKRVIYDLLGKYDLFIWLEMTVLKVLFKPIILINQYDG